MVYLAYIAFLFLGIQLTSALLNLIFRQKIGKTEKPINELISILIPARNEEKNISALLSDLTQIENKNIEIIVFDDESTDKTPQIINEFAQKDNRIQLIQSEGLPAGWLGKNYACYQLAQKAKGKYLIFLDADVRIDKTLINDVVSYAEKNQVKLLSIFPTQIQETFGERVSIPLMNYILLTLLPLIFVKISPFTSHAAANGQFMLFDAETYKKLNPHYRFKHSAVEDIKIARFFKKNKIKIACLTGEKRIKCRMYNSYNEAVKGFSKNILMFFGNSYLFAITFWLFSCLGFIPVLITMPAYVIYYFAVLGLIIAIYSLVSQQSIINNILLYPLQMYFFTSILINAIIAKKKKNLIWKERNIY